MQSFIYQFVSILFFLLINNLTQSLRWENSNKAGPNESRILLASTKTGPVIDAYHGKQVIIVKKIPTYSYPITIYCFVAGYKNDSQLSYQFCAKNNCQKISSFGYLPGTSMKITGETVSKKKGIKLQIKLKPDADSSDEFYCEVTDDKNLLYIRSALIQIRDVYYWERNLVTNKRKEKSLHPTIDRNHLPITFPCIRESIELNENQPNWVPLENLNPIHWNLCPVKPNFSSLKVIEKMTFQTCVEFSVNRWSDNKDPALRPKKIKEMTSWKYLIDASGNLTVLDFGPSAVSYALMCYRKTYSGIHPLNTYISKYSGDDIVQGVEFIALKTEKKINLSPISPVYQSVLISARNALLPTERTRPVTIFAKYYSSSSAKWKWFHNRKELHNDMSVPIDKYSIRFTTRITVANEGNYTLEIKDATDRLNFTINVRIVGSPGLINQNCMPNVYHVWENGHILFSCNYQYRPNFLKFKINQQDIKKNYSNGVDLFRKENYPHLNSLRFEISPQPYEKFSFENVFYKAYSLNKFQDHVIMISTENDYGSHVVSTSIYVLPSVESQIENFPRESSCLSYCSSHDKHDFFCRFKEDGFLNKDLQIYHYWIIENEELNPSKNSSHILMPYFTIDPKTKDLKLHPINSNNYTRDQEVKRLLKQNSFECRIKLVSNVDHKIIYDSRSDEKLKRKFFSKITLDDKTSYIVYGISIGLIALLFFVFGVWFVRRLYQNRGKTYKMEAIDINLGIDPEKELNELCIKDYQPWSEYADKMFVSSSDIDDQNFYEEMNANTL